MVGEIETVAFILLFLSCSCVGSFIVKTKGLYNSDE